MARHIPPLDGTMVGCEFWSSKTRGCSPTRSPTGCAGTAWRSTWSTTEPARSSAPTVNDYDVVVLDRDLPAVHGDDVCRALGESDGETRILMLTAAAAVTDRVDGLGLGADDYLPKPFAFDELIARVQALARRATARGSPGARAQRDQARPPPRK